MVLPKFLQKLKPLFKYQGYSIYFAILNKETASQLLEINSGNREVDKAQVANIQRQMLLGKWLPFINNIKITKDGILFDAQHTCVAVYTCEKDLSIPFFITVGHPDISRVKTDKGKKRTFQQSCDSLEIEGSVGNGPLMTRIMRIDHDKLRGMKSKESFPLDDEEMIQRMGSPDVKNVISILDSMGNPGNRRFSRAVIGGSLYYILKNVKGQKNKKKAVSYIRQVYTGMSKSKSVVDVLNWADRQDGNNTVDQNVKIVWGYKGYSHRGQVLKVTDFGVLPEL